MVVVIGTGGLFPRTVRHLFHYCRFRLRQFKLRGFRGAASTGFAPDAAPAGGGRQQRPAAPALAHRRRHRRRLGRQS